MAVHPLRAPLRRILLAHGEKLALASVAVLLLAAVLGTRWTRSPLQVDDMTERTGAARARIAQTDWPEEERQRFALSGTAGVADLIRRSLRDPVPLAAYAASHPFTHRLGEHERPLQDPVLHPVQELIASSERVLIRQSTFAPAVLPLESVPERLPDMIPDEFRPRGGERTVPARRPEPTLARAATRADAAAGASPLSSSGRGYAFVSVRGWFDLEQQVRAYVDAIHKGFAQAEREFEIIDFDLERQRLLGEERWSPWEAVDREVYFDVVRSAAGLEHDVVAADVTDSAITCPLPARITGRWNKQATHPRLEQYELSDEDYERELEFLSALTKRARLESQSRQQGLTKRGFTELVQDAYSLRQSVFGTRHESATNRAIPPRFGAAARPADTPLNLLVQELAREIDPKQVDQRLSEWIRARATSPRRLLLFRYLDFDVEPGATYRYRVRFELRNPNYRKSLAAAGGVTHVVEGPTRRTPWSAPTSPVTVEPTTSYFLTGIEKPRARLYPEARLHLFQYDHEAGTTVESVLPVSFGQRIGGTARTTRLNPVRGGIEEGLYAFRSQHTLVDGLADLVFFAADHPDLELPRDVRGRAFLTQFALVVRPDLEMEAIDTLTQADDYALYRQRMVWQAEQLESLQRSSDADYERARQSDEDLYDRGSSAPRRSAAPPRPRAPLQGL